MDDELTIHFFLSCMIDMLALNPIQQFALKISDFVLDARSQWNTASPTQRTHVSLTICSQKHDGLYVNIL
jgi:hypothetical protein